MLLHLNSFNNLNTLAKGLDVVRPKLLSKDDSGFSFGKGSHVGNGGK